jgi:enoyl-CoA hydratase/carnithine racemase
MQSIVRHPKPVIAEIDGIATAAGCQLVASCDLAIASDKATFGVNGIDVGLFCTTPGVALAARPEAASMRWKCCSRARWSTPPPRANSAWSTASCRANT